MRTTIRIEEGLYRQAKAVAARSGRTVSEVIEDAVRVALQPRPPEASSLPDLPTYGGSGVQPGVDLGDLASLRDLMDADRLEAIR